MADLLELGTLYQSLERTVRKYGDLPAYAVPPMPGRAYHPDGWQATWSQTWAEVQRRKAHYAASGYGPGHRVAILFDQRPESSTTSRSTRSVAAPCRSARTIGTKRSGICSSIRR